MTVSLVGKPQKMKVRLVKEWDRGNLPDIVSGSSGPKDTIANQVRAAFDANPGIDRLRMFVSMENKSFGQAFCLTEVKQNWYDMCGAAVEVSE